MRKYIGAIAISLAALTISKYSYATQPQPQPQPLSCNMFILLSTTTAMLRDQGKSKAEVRAVLSSEDDLTKKEIEIFLKLAFVDFKDRSPKEISKIAERACSLLK